MNDIKNVLELAIPALETWIREIIHDEVTKALQADREKKQYVKQYTREETAQMLNISLPTLWAWTKSGKINAVHIGRKPMYTEEEINRIMQK
jgi:excisionase family DNA binding protein